MKEKYFEVRIAFTGASYGKIYDYLSVYGDIAMLEEETAFVVCFESREKAMKLAKDAAGALTLENEMISVSEFTNKDWNREWQNSVKPVKIGRKMIIYPSWLKNELGETGEKILVEIDPKMSFGTGHNETTQIMLEMMCRYLKGDEESLLDFGCGTAILAIAGIKLGVERAVAVDNDEEAIANAIECVKKNKVASNVEVVYGDIEDIEEEGFEVICANILSSVIIEKFEQIDSRIAKGGKLFLSGILISEDRDILEYLFQNDFEVEDIQSRNDWIGIYAVKH